MSNIKPGRKPHLRSAVTRIDAAEPALELIHKDRMILAALCLNARQNLTASGREGRISPNR